eukprot:7231250-Prymnesium_polylepis.1
MAARGVGVWAAPLIIKRSPVSSLNQQHSRPLKSDNRTEAKTHQTQLAKHEGRTSDRAVCA